MPFFRVWLTVFFVFFLMIGKHLKETRVRNGNLLWASGTKERRTAAHQERSNLPHLQSNHLPAGDRKAEDQVEVEVGGGGEALVQEPVPVKLVCQPALKRCGMMLMSQISLHHSPTSDPNVHLDPSSYLEPHTQPCSFSSFFSHNIFFRQ